VNIPEIPEWDESVTSAIDEALKLFEKFPLLKNADPDVACKLIGRIDRFERQMTSTLPHIEIAIDLMAKRRELYKSLLLKIATLREKLDGRESGN
jgi:hypothetical protein